MRNADKPITPVALGVQNSDAHAPEEGDLIGLTKREYFTAMAMQGLLARADGSGSFSALAERAAKYADALLTELDKPQL